VIGQLVLGAMMILVTTSIQGGFTVAAVVTLRRHLTGRTVETNLHATLVLTVFVLWLFLTMFVEIAAWAVLYASLDVLPTLEASLYFSTVTFTTLGTGDVLTAAEWRLLASSEAVNGLLLFGWSAALVFAVVQWVYRHQPLGPPP